MSSRRATGDQAKEAIRRWHAQETGEPITEKLNWLRAGVLGANDGIISTAGLVVGVAGATADRTALLVAGTAGLVAGALSMAGGEYVSVSTQRDTERAALRKEAQELAEMPHEELDELTDSFVERGLDRELARQVAVQLTERDALTAHARMELGIDPGSPANPWHAAWASLVAFAVGALLPLLAIVLPAAAWRVPVTWVAVTAALVVTGTVSAWLGHAPVGRAVARNVVVGTLAMGLTFAVGTLLGRFGG